MLLVIDQGIILETLQLFRCMKWMPLGLPSQLLE